MINKSFIVKLKRTAIFFAIFTVVYILFFLTLPYTLPFVLGFIIALLAKPLNKFMQRKFKIPNGISSIGTTLLVFALIIIIISVILFNIINEAILLTSKIPNMDSIKVYIDYIVNEGIDIFDRLDPAFSEKVYQYLNTMLKTTLDVVIKVLNSILGFALKVPSFMMLAFITLLATFFFSKDMTFFNTSFYSMFSENGKERISGIIKESIGLITGYIKAFLTVIFVTFVETLIGFWILGIDYALLLSILASFMDILPIVGVSIVYIPLIAYFLLIGDFFTAIGLLLLLGFVTVVRQILEPKLISSTLDIHPILTLAAIFIGLKAYGFVGMIYLIALIILYKILNMVKAL